MTEQIRLRRDGALAGRIADYVFDAHGGAVPFSQRLAGENGWTHAFAVRVLDEYRRFAYLACVAGEDLTPSDEVDRVWHLHLAQSRAYWEDFCPNVLKRDFHRGPEPGVAEETPDEPGYIRTLQHYAAVFGEAPPIDIWPPPEVRFGLADDCGRVNRNFFTLTPRQDLPHQPAPAERNFTRPLILAPLFAVLLAVSAFYAAPGADWRDPVLWATLGTAGFAVMGRVVAAVLRSLDASREALRPVAFSQELHGHEVSYAVRDGRTTVTRVRPKPSGNGGTESWL